MSCQRLNIAGTKVSVVTMPVVLAAIERWLSERSGRYIVCRDVPGVIRARTDSSLHAIHERAGFVTPDGAPLVWTAKLLGCRDVSRVCGPDLLSAAAERGVALGWKHYFYGSSPNVIENLTRELRAKFPGITVVGSYSPPFRTTTAEEDDLACERIRASGADLVWVGLGSPKQEYWMADNAQRCGGAVLIGIGAAFDFHAGTVTRAPSWMRERGLEWAYRLFQEPQRLWRRYLVLAPQFILYASVDVAKSNLTKLTRRFDTARRLPQRPRERRYDYETASEDTRELLSNDLLKSSYFKSDP